MAICWEQGEAARLLLQLGADPNQVGGPGSTLRGLERLNSGTFAASPGAGFACANQKLPVVFPTDGLALVSVHIGLVLSRMQLLEPHNNGGYYQIFSETSGAEEVGPVGQQRDAAAREQCQLLGCKRPAWQRRLCRKPPYVGVNSMGAVPFLCRCGRC